MKTDRLVILTVTIALCAFTAIIYSSCKKDSCKGVACENGGTCTNGICQCPSGYSGTSCSQSTIIYINDTYTPVTITVNNTTHILAAQGGFASFTGTAGGPAVVTAYTSATSPEGWQVGSTVNWSFTNTFPTGGNGVPTVPIDVPATYFYLTMVNANNYANYINCIIVNYGSANPATDSVKIPDNAKQYNIGYFPAQPNTLVFASDSAGTTWKLPASINYSLNATATVIIP